MLGSEMLDVAIRMVFVYFLLSLINPIWDRWVSEVQEDWKVQSQPFERCNCR